MAPDITIRLLELGKRMANPGIAVHGYGCAKLILAWAV